MARTINDVIEDFNNLQNSVKIVGKGTPDEPFSFSDLMKRIELREEYIGLLSEDKKLAIELSRKLNSNDLDFIHFDVEVYGIVDDWTAEYHRKYLEKARELLKVVSYEDCMNILNILYNEDIPDGEEG